MLSPLAEVPWLDWGVWFSVWGLGFGVLGLGWGHFESVFEQVVL